MTRKTVTAGKYRALQRASTPGGTFNIVALDHLDSLRRAMNLTDPASLTVQQLTDFKAETIRIFAPETSGVLLDAVLGAAQAIQGHYLGRTGLLVGLEQGDYQLAAIPEIVKILPEWSVEKIKRLGADGVKLFFYYHPDAVQLTAAQDALISQIVADCTRYDIPLYAEPILLAVDEDSETFLQNFTRHLLTTAQRIAALGVDVLKLEFPVDARRQPDQAVWRESCEIVSRVIDVPWVLLSAGVDFDTFCRQVEIACASGASGYIAGRAVWGEVSRMPDSSQRIAWLEDTGRKRLRMLADAASGARPWINILACEPVNPDWHKTYHGFSA